MSRDFHVAAEFCITVCYNVFMKQTFTANFSDGTVKTRRSDHAYTFAYQVKAISEGHTITEIGFSKDRKGAEAAANAFPKTNTVSRQYGLTTVCGKPVISRRPGRLGGWSYTYQWADSFSIEIVEVRPS